MMRHPRVWMGLLLWLVFSSAHASWGVNMTPGATEVSRSVFDLHMTIFWICVVIGIIVVSLIPIGIEYVNARRAASRERKQAAGG